jgi:cell shape-determining protein MreC
MIALINNHLIGRGAEVYPAYSKVQLLTDKMMKVSACCAQAKAYGILTGLCKPTEIALNFVDHLQDVQTGTMVLSSGTGLLYPQGLCLGTIIQAIKKDVTYDIVVKPLVDFAQLTYIFLLPPPLISQQQPVTPQTHTVPEVTKSVPASVQPTQVLVQDKPAEEVGKPAAEAESKINI